MHPEQIAGYPLIDALVERRSRRFAKSGRLNGGPLAYTSTAAPQPLTREEEAVLAFAAAGITGPTLAELPYATGDQRDAGSGNVIRNLVGRTLASGDGIHSVIVLVLNDDGAWMLKRPQDYPRATVPELAASARRHEWEALYDAARVRIADRRPELPRVVPFTPPFNKWSANQPGTTYFLPVAELTTLYINIMLTAFSEELAYFSLDDRARFQPAGIARFARSRGGHLDDNPAHGRVGTVTLAESWVLEFTAVEQGEIVQNLGLMTQALGLGGFTHFAAHPYGWPQALGFRMENPPLSRTIGAGPVTARLLRVLGRDIPVPTAVGLEHDGAVLVKPYCPPYYRSMKEAVIAYVDSKFAPSRGTLRDGGATTLWRDGAAVQAGIPRYSDRAIAATIAYCTYIYTRYGRFPAGNGPFRTVVAYQAHHLDPAFYATFYQPGASSATQRADFGEPP